jgi:hypothetical protein
MEELLSRIQNKDIAEYMREALGCYNAAAYRACVVLSYIAVFDDLRRKLAQLGSINSTAKTISKEVEQRATGQQIYESYMVDQLKAENLITEIEAFRLEQIRVLRNKAAHPSGLHPSAEEARYVYYEAIDKFLSRPVLNTTHGVDRIIKELNNNNFFPSRNLDDVKMVVSGEMSTLHHLATPYLVSRLVESSDSVEETLSANAKLFISGLAAKDDVFIRKQLQQRLLIPKANDSSKSALLTGVVSVNPMLLTDLDSTTLIRLRSMLEASVDSYKYKPVAGVGHPAQLLWNLVDKLGSEYVTANFLGFAESVATAFCYTVPVIQAAGKSALVHKLLLNRWKENAGSGQFAIANTFAESVPQLDSLLMFLEPEEAFDIVLAVCRAAKWGAYGAISLRDQTFSSTPSLLSLAVKYMNDNPNAAEEKAQAALSMSASELSTTYLSAS